MTTAMQGNKYTDEELQNVVDHKEEKKTKEQMTSNNYQDVIQKTFEMNIGNKRKGKWNSQIRSKKYHKNNLMSNNYLTYKQHDDNEDNYSHTNKSYSDLEPKQLKQLSLECESINEDHVQNEKCNSENTDIDRNQLEHNVMTIVQSQKNKSSISLINEWAMSVGGSCGKQPFVSYTLVAISEHTHGIMYTYMCQVNDKRATGEGQSKQKAKQNAAAQMLEKHFKVLEKNEDHVQNEKCNSENTDIDRNLLEHYVITIVQPQKSMTPISLINDWAMKIGGSHGIPLIVSYTLVALTGYTRGIMYTYMCQVNDKRATGEGRSKQEAKQNAAAQMLEKHFKVLEKNEDHVQPQKNKTPISLINDWAMQIGRSHGKPPIVSFTLVAITGHAHTPMFTYICQVNDKTAKGEGQSKKEAKQNAAAQMWEKLFKVSSTTNNDKVITSTEIADNFEVNENDVTNPSSTEGSQIIIETDSNIEDEKLLQHSNSNMVKIAYCNMNPVGALQEIISTAHNLAFPVYDCEEIFLLNKDQQPDGVNNTVSYKVTCQVFHLKTTGIASTKKKAKELAARLMIDQIRNIGEEKFNTLKS